MQSIGQESPLHTGTRGAADTEVWRGVRAILSDLLNRPESAITPDASLGAQLGFDSLMMIELSVRLEERFDIVVPPNASPADINVKTASDVVEFVEGLLKARERSEA